MWLYRGKQKVTGMKRGASKDNLPLWLNGFLVPIFKSIW